MSTLMNDSHLVSIDSSFVKSDSRSVLMRIADQIGSAIARTASRKALAKLDERQLKDIGLSRELALEESARSFWDTSGGRKPRLY